MKPIRFNLIHSSKRKKKLRKDGTGPVWVCAYQGGKHKYYPTNVVVEPKQWDARHTLIKNHPNATAYNSLLSKRLSELIKYQVDLINEKYGEHVSLKEFDEKFRVTGGKRLSFCEFYEMTVENRKEIGETTRQTQRNTLNHLRLSVGRIPFSELNYNLVDGFHQYLLGEEKGLTTIDKYHRHVKTYINLAINKGYLNPGLNPYDNFNYDRGNAKPKDFLRLEEIELLEQMDLNQLTLEETKARDIFLLMCYTGLRFSDAVAMCPKYHLTETRKGFHYSALMVKNQRRKKKEINLPLYALFHFSGESESRAQRIVKRCMKKYHVPGKAFFDGLTNTMINENIKVVAHKAGLNKHLTCHVGRHSFGTNMAVRVPVSLLQIYMGHTKIETTMQYIHMSRKIQDDVIEKIRWEKASITPI
ncbi:MAG: site-specific integrase [Saprospiraceae bacterium]|nr:site-specific integrase [Saprospiraceae bacterium]MCB9323996.1 tyrosine-type recombinase/integrase [Lewinellaceae bacterium]